MVQKENMLIFILTSKKKKSQPTVKDSYVLLHLFLSTMHVKFFRSYAILM